MFQRSFYRVSGSPYPVYLLSLPSELLRDSKCVIAQRLAWVPIWAGCAPLIVIVKLV